MSSLARSDAPPRAREAGVELIAGRYEIEEVIGRGGMGAVYRVRDRRSGSQLALKRLAVRKRKKDESTTLFEREFHTLAQLRHPRIIAVHDYGIDAQGAYYTMELLAGADMRQLAPLPWPLACTYLREVATSLALLHARKLVHRDVTPQNVRVTDDGHCKLIDFGALADFGASGSVIGTPPCVPPEAVDGKPIDQRLDLYALGCLGYWMLTGCHAYPATDSRQLRAFWARTPAPPSQARPNEASDGAPLPMIPAALDALIMALLALDPRARPSSASAVIDRLDAIANPRAQSIRAPAPLLGETSQSIRAPAPGAAPQIARTQLDISLAESCLASAPLCGRAAELAQVKLALERTLRGRGASLVLSGPAGIGRTRALAEIELRAKLEGLTTLRVNAAEHPQPFGSVRALIAQLEGAIPPSLAPATTTHAELHARLVLASKTVPLALLIDDVHRADEASLGVLGMLAHEARHLPLALISAQRSHDQATSASALHGLVQRSSEITLGELREPHLSQWLSSVLGDAPNLGRLCSFLHARTSGRPGGVASLLRFLITSGALDYRDGTWMLPTEPAQIDLPADLEQTALERLRKLPAPIHARALALAEALSLHRDVLPAELCAAIGGEGVAASLDALVRSEIWIRAGNDYRFASEAIRQHVLIGVAAERRTALHARMAQLLLARDSRTAHDDLAAGVHLLEARDVRGLSLATHAAITIAKRGEGIGSAVDMLERALALGAQLGMSSTQELALLSPLGLGAYLVDHRLVRHEAAIVRTVDDVSGLARTRALQARLGRWGAFLGMAIGLIAFYVRRDREPGVRFRTIMTIGVAAMMGLAGRATVCLDKPAIDRVYKLLRPLRAFGLNDPGGFALAYCKGLGMAIEDRYERTYQYWLELERILLKPGGMRGVTAQQRALWKGGASYVLGIFEGSRGDKRALERARELEQSGDMHALIASQIRLHYHGFRGEAEAVRDAYERMEACAIRTGSSWQVEAWSPIAINLFGALWHDIVIIKRTLHQLRRLAQEIPSLSRYVVSAEALYLLRRGQPRDCADLYEPMLEQEAPLSRIGWSVSSGLLAEAYNDLAMHEEAKALCERVLATVGPEDRPYYAMRMPIEVSYAMALSGLGQHERASAHLTDLLACYGADSSPAALGSVHEALARIELSRGNRKGFTKHLKRVEALLTHVGNPALIARFQALSDLAGEGGGILTKIAASREVRAFEATIDLLQGEQLLLGARHILTWLMRSCEGYDGYLFVRGEGKSEEPRLLAATSEREPNAEVFESVADALDALGGDGDTTNFGTAAASTTKSDGSSTHLFLLSYLEADSFHAEGALVLLGRAPVAPPVRYELLQAAALQLRRLSG